jgi:hypothetical protein
LGPSHATTPRQLARALLKFDTDNHVPLGATIVSAKLTVYVKAATSNAETRTITAYDVRESFDESEATWNQRKVGINWATSGITVGSIRATASAVDSEGHAVEFDVAAWVQVVVDDQQADGSRYTRIALLDTGTASRESYKEYYAADSTSVGTPLKPKLVVVYE